MIGSSLTLMGEPQVRPDDRRSADGNPQSPAVLSGTHESLSPWRAESARFVRSPHTGPLARIARWRWLLHVSVRGRRFCYAIPSGIEEDYTGNPSPVPHSMHSWQAWLSEATSISLFQPSAISRYTLILHVMSSAHEVRYIYSEKKSWA